jgi:hypothetical protein
MRPTVGPPADDTALARGQETQPVDELGSVDGGGYDGSLI